MKQLTSACHEILSQLESVLTDLSPHEYRAPVPALSNSTIGQHVRHTIEFFSALEKGIQTGTIDYDKRNRDLVLETDNLASLVVLEKIRQFLIVTHHDKVLTLMINYNEAISEGEVLQTSFWRELTYIVEHAIHHMAIIKIGIRSVAPHVILPDSFGVAVSTIRHKKTSASIQDC